MNLRDTKHWNREMAGPNWQGLSESQQLKLTEILDRCIADFESGKPVDESAILAEHPELADALKEHFESIRFLYEAATGYRPDITENELGGAPREIGGYRIIREIGRGGMGVVYEAQDVSLLRKVALKVLPFAALLDHKQVARFRNEAQAAGQLHHPHIVPVYAVGCDRGVHYFAMQLVEGQPLDLAIREMRQSQTAKVSRERLSSNADETMTAAISASTARIAHAKTDDVRPTHQKSSATQASTSPWQSYSTLGQHTHPDYLRNVATVGIHIAEALQQAHDIGILHRDIKPSNLLLDESGKVWVTDFGLAHVPSEESMTMSGDVMGTVRYMSPEQAAGRTKFVDHRSDIYSLGITLYELATLQRAFDSENREEFLADVATRDPVSPRRLNRSLPVDLETIILKSIAKEPEQRYQSAQELADDLQCFLDGRPTKARRPTIADRINKWARRHHRLVTAAAVLAILSSIITGVAALKINHTLAIKEAETNRANENFRKARNAVTDLGPRFAEQLTSIPGTRHVQQEILARSQEYYRDFIKQAQNIDGLTADLAHAMANTGKILQLQEKYHESLAEYDSAVENYESLLSSEPMNQHARAQLGRCLCSRALVYAALEQYRPALSDIERSIHIHESQMDAGNSTDATSASRDLAKALSNHVYLLSLTKPIGDPEALESIQRAVQLQRKLVDATPDDDLARQELAVYLHNLSLQIRDADYQQALERCQEALSLQLRLVRKRPHVISFQRDLALSYNNLAQLQLSNNQLDAAIPSFQASVDLTDRVAQSVPGEFTLDRDLAVVTNRLGQAFLAARQFTAAQHQFESCRTLLAEMETRYGANSELEETLGHVNFNLACAGEAQGKKKQAIQFMNLGKSQYESAIRMNPDDPQHLQSLDLHLKRFANLLLSNRQIPEAFKNSWDRVALWETIPSALIKEGTKRHKFADIANQLEDIVATAEDLALGPEEIKLWKDKVKDLRQRMETDGSHHRSSRMGRLNGISSQNVLGTTFVQR